MRPDVFGYIREYRVEDTTKHRFEAEKAKPCLWDDGSWREGYLAQQADMRECIPPVVGLTDKARQLIVSSVGIVGGVLSISRYYVGGEYRLRLD
jgi:hypothetical protein